MGVNIKEIQARISTVQRTSSEEYERLWTSADYFHSTLSVQEDGSALFYWQKETYCVKNPAEFEHFLSLIKPRKNLKN